MNSCGLDLSRNIDSRGSRIQNDAVVRPDQLYRGLADGGTAEVEVSPELVDDLCLGDQQLRELSLLAERCERVYGPARDIEWAIADGKLYLLQCRAVTTTGS